MKIALVNSSLDCGGAQRVMAIMANYWASRGEDVTLITLDRTDRDFYPLDRRIRRIGLGLIAPSPNMYVAFKSNIRQIRRLRAAMRECEPNAVISFLDKMNVVTLIATLGLRVPVVISERVDPRVHTIEPIWSKLRCWLYPRAHALVVQTTTVSDWALRFLPDSQVHVIPNPVEIKTGNAAAATVDINIRPPLVIAVGRLQAQKGFDLLVQATAQCEQRNWSLLILGEGPDRERLESMVKQYGLETRVHMPGNVSSVVSALRQACMFVLSSRYEGFPNALLEAMSCGLPVISFDCPSGPGDIIEDGVNGVLVPAEDVQGLACAIDRLMTDRNERQRLGDEARNVITMFSIEKIMDSWQQLLVEMSMKKT